LCASGHFDLEAFELFIRSEMHRIGARMLETMINDDHGGYQGRTISGEQGQCYEFMGYRTKEVLTVLGPVSVKRAYYYDRASNEGFCPKDRDLDIAHSSYSAGARRLISKVGAYRPFGLGHEDLYELAALRVSAKEVQRVSEMVGQQVEQCSALATVAEACFESIPRMYVCMDGTGIPVVKKETEGRQGKDGAPKTREVKLGCVFTQTQTAVDDKTGPVRDEESTSYVGAIEPAEAFGRRIYQEATRRGMDAAREVCVLGDGAPWIWNLADEHFYGATQIVDLYHAREHYWTVAKACFGNDSAKLRAWAEERRKELDAGEVPKVIAAINECASLPGCQDVCEREGGYFEKNKERMRYAEFRQRGLFVGSGVLEAGCRTVVAQRLKQSGMHWSVCGANAIVALRCAIMSNRWEEFWELRAAA
jgi:hypothetical protein